MLLVRCCLQWRAQRNQTRSSSSLLRFFPLFPSPPFSLSLFLLSSSIAIFPLLSYYRYRLHFHIFEERHSIPLFSGEGPLVCQEWQNHHEHRTILRLGPGAAVVTTTFFASGCGGGVGGGDVEGDGSAGGRGGRRQRVER